MRPSKLPGLPQKVSAPPLSSEADPNPPISSELYYFRNGNGIPTELALKHVWTGKLCLWSGDNGILSPKQNIWIELLGFGHPSYTYDDLQYHIDAAVRNTLQLCPSHTIIGWKLVGDKKSDAVKLDRRHFSQFKKEMFEDIIEIGIYILSS